eukprot:ANDGO_01400.mRNA.1 Nuclear transcription factor Y subunit C-4
MSSMDAASASASTSAAGSLGYKTELPLARVKRIMKADPDTKVISHDALWLTTRCAELFLVHLSQRAADVTKATSRKTMSYADVAVAVKRHSELDFLADIVPSKKVVSRQAALRALGPTVVSEKPLDVPSPMDTDAEQ